VAKVVKLNLTIPLIVVLFIDLLYYDKVFLCLARNKFLEAYKRIGEIAKTRKERKVSQLALSLEMGYKSVSVVSFAEISLKGAHFNIAHLLQISTILNVPLIELLDGVQDIIDMSKTE
jgi:hypothetical protein